MPTPRKTDPDLGKDANDRSNDTNQGSGRPGGGNPGGTRGGEGRDGDHEQGRNPGVGHEENGGGRNSRRATKTRVH